MIKPWEDEKTGKTFCPVNGWDCPYFKSNGSCDLEDVEKYCDDFYTFWGDEIEEYWKKNNL